MSISGSFGGGGRDNSIKERPNDLFSRSTARALYLLSEGQIQGFLPGVNPGTQLYIDETPLLRQDGSPNFQGLSYSWSPGTPGEGPLPGFDEPASEVQVSSQLRQNTPIVRQFFNPNASSVSLTFRVPALYRVKDNEIRGTAISIRVEVSPDGLPWQLLEEVVISGKTNSAYTTQRRFPIPPASTSTWQLRVTRLTEDSSSSQMVNDSFWIAYTIFEPSGKVFPSVARLGIAVESEQFNSFPQLSGDLYGINNFKIPHNYDPWTRTYTGPFNGLMITGWTNNPAWVLYNLLVNSRYGAGALPGYPGISEDNVDIWSFYEAGVYNDGLVPDGLGGFEPRYRFDIYQLAAVDAEDMLGYLEQVQRARLYDNGQKISLRQDRPRNWVKIFNETNVVFRYDQDGRFIEGGFSYESVDITTAVNDIECRFINPQLNWEEDSAFYRDAALINRNGQRVSVIDGVGITSRGQATRACKWEFFTANNQPYIITFSVGDEGELVGIGDVVKISDPNRMGYELGGRLAQPILAGASLVVLDTAPEINVVGGTLSLMLSNGQPFSAGITAQSGTHVQLAASLPQSAPQSFPWEISLPTAQAQFFEVVRVKDRGDEYQIEGVSYNPGKYDFVELGLQLPVIDISDLPDPTQPPPPPSELNAIETLRLVGGIPESFVDIFWRSPEYPLVANYEFQWQEVGDPVWSDLSSPPATNTSVGPIAPGLYSFRVRTVNPLGRRSIWVTLSGFVVDGKVTPPNNVENFRARLSSESSLKLTWTPTTELDVVVGGRILIRYLPEPLPNLSPEATWVAAIALAELGGGSSQTDVQARNGVYLARWQDYSGSLSPVPAFASVDGIEAVLSNIVVSIDQAGWPGERVRLEEAQDPAHLITETISGWQILDLPWEEIEEEWETYENTTEDLSRPAYDAYYYVPGEYILEPGTKTDVTAELRYSSYTPALTPGTGVATVEFSSAGASGEEPWSDWAPLGLTLRGHRRVRFRVATDSGAVPSYVELRSLNIILDVQDRSVYITEESSGSGWKYVAFDPPFNAAPASLLVYIQEASGIFNYRNLDRFGFEFIVYSGPFPVVRSVAIATESY